MKKILLGLLLLTSMTFGEVTETGNDKGGFYVITVNDEKANTHDEIMDITKWSYTQEGMENLEVYGTLDLDDRYENGKVKSKYYVVAK